MLRTLRHPQRNIATVAQIPKRTQHNSKLSILPYIQRNTMSNKQHGPAPTNWALDGREVDLLHYIYGRSDIKELKGQPTRVLAAIDEYHSKYNMLMNIGDAKGGYIEKTIQERKPSVMIELGVYVGYSAILFGNAVRQHGGKRYIGIEKNPEMAAVANQLVNLAGLSDIVQILVGSSNEVLRDLVNEKQIEQIELIFIDHWQELYLPDIWLLEELNLLKPNVSMLIADNIIMPGAPEYRRWVEASTEEKRKIAKSAKTGGLSPNPNLVYETVPTEFQTDFGKDAVTVTRVVGKDNNCQ